MAECQKGLKSSDSSATKTIQMEWQNGDNDKLNDSNHMAEDSQNLSDLSVQLIVAGKALVKW
jgi:hypothetical protein